MKGRPQLGTAVWRKTAADVLRRDFYACQACGAPATMAGHKVPPERYAGSHNDPANLIALCRSCNVSMGGRDYEEWLRLPYGRPAEIPARTPVAAPNRTLYGRRAAPLVDRPAKEPPPFRYHVHDGRMLGNMSMKPEWPSDGTCPPECPLLTAGA